MKRALPTLLLSALLCAGMFSLLLPATAAGAATNVTLYVSPSGSATTNCSSAGSACTTIQEGITAAEALTTSDVTVDVAVGTYTENDTIAVPTGDTLAIQGPSSGLATLNGGGAGSDFNISSGTASIDGLSITGGSSALGGGISNNGGTLTLADDTISGNSATNNGGGVYNESGGSTTLDNDTTSNDSATNNGGGVYNDGGTVNAVDVTFFSDTASTAGGVDNASGSTSMANSILSSAACSGAIVDGGYNVESDNSCGFGPNDVVGSSTIGLTSLAANGSSGPETFAIATNSSAFEEVPLAQCTIPTDERGEPRPGSAGASCDAGAFEYQVGATSLSLAGSPVTGNNVYNVTLTVPSGGPAPIETVVVKDSASNACGATLTLSTATTYSGSCAINSEIAGETVDATYDADGHDTNYTKSTSNALTVEPGTETIVFTSVVPTSPTVGNTYVVTATGGQSSSAVTFTIDASSTSGACTISGSTVTFVAVGTCVVDANQAANSSYLAAPQVQQSVIINTLGTQTIVFTSVVPTSPNVGKTYVVAATGGKSTNPVTFSIDGSSKSGACTISGSTVTFVAVGTCVVDANQAANSSYLAAPQVQQSVTIIAAGSTPPPVKVVNSGARIVIVKNTLTKSGAIFHETVKLACRNDACAGLLKSIGQISITKDVSVKSGPWTVTKKVTKVTKVVLASASYRLASGKNEQLTLNLTAGGRNVLAKAKPSTPVRETLTATANGGNTATSKGVVR
jgi:hypothetical protein